MLTKDRRIVHIQDRGNDVDQEARQAEELAKLPPEWQRTEEESLMMSDILPTSRGSLLHNEYHVETKVTYDSKVCNRTFHDTIESTTSLPVSMLLRSGLHGFTVPEDFQPVNLANVTLLSPENQFKEGELRFSSKVENLIIVNTLSVGRLYSLDQSMLSMES